MSTTTSSISLLHTVLTWWQRPAPALPARQAVWPVTLRRGQLYRLAAMPGQCLQASGGDLWVTFDGDPAEHVVEAGQTWQVPIDRPLLVQALSDARMIQC